MLTHQTNALQRLPGSYSLYYFLLCIKNNNGAGRCETHDGLFGKRQSFDDLIPYVRPFFLQIDIMLCRNTANVEMWCLQFDFVLLFTFRSAEEEEEEEIAPPQPVDETQTEIPDQKVEEEGTNSSDAWLQKYKSISGIIQAMSSRAPL